MAHHSEAGCAHAKLPTIVPRERIGGCAMLTTARANSAPSGPGTARADSKAPWRTKAPTRSVLSSTLNWSSPAMRLMSTTSSGRMRCRCISRIRLCPPASTWALRPVAPSTSTASATVRGTT